MLVLHGRAWQMVSAPFQASFPNQQSVLDWRGGQAIVRLSTSHARRDTDAITAPDGRVGGFQRTEKHSIVLAAVIGHGSRHGRALAKTWLW